MDAVVLLLLLFTWWMRRGEKATNYAAITKAEQRQILKEIDSL